MKPEVTKEMMITTLGHHAIALVYATDLLAKFTKQSPVDHRFQMMKAAAESFDEMTDQEMEAFLKEKYPFLELK